MAQLLVRDIEASIVKRLRARAAAEGVSVEEAHRRLLRSTLLGDVPDAKGSFVEYLRSMPTAEEVEIARAPDLPREVVL